MGQPDLAQESLITELSSKNKSSYLVLERSSYEMFLPSIGQNLSSLEELNWGA